MLWALLALYLFGSSGTSSIITSIDQIKASIKAEVAAADRRTELLSIVEEAEKTAREELKSRRTAAKELLTLAERHAAKAGDIQPVLNRFRTDVEAYQEQMIRYRFDLKAKMTREEWTRVFSAKEPEHSRK